MTRYDSSVLIDYLDGADAAVRYIEAQHDQRAVAPPLVLFEVYQGEIHKSRSADFDAVEGVLEWVTIVDEPRDMARSAAELQNELAGDGSPLSARDAFIAGAAMGLNETLAVSDTDFDVQGITEQIDVDFV